MNTYMMLNRWWTVREANELEHVDFIALTK